MPGARLFLLFAACVLAASGIDAQNRPNLSGTWLIERPGQNPPEQRITIQQDTKTFTVDSMGYGVAGTKSTSYLFRTAFVTDGAEHPLTYEQVTPDSPVVLNIGDTTARATWIGPQLVVMKYSTRELASPNRKFTVRRTTREVYALDAHGNLVKDSLTIEDPNPTFAELETPAPRRSVYRRAMK